jgi:hypothetical protein
MGTNFRHSQLYIDDILKNIINIQLWVTEIYSHSIVNIHSGMALQKVKLLASQADSIYEYKIKNIINIQLWVTEICSHSIVNIHSGMALQKVKKQIFIAENVLPGSGRVAFRLRHFSPFYFQLDTSSAKLSSFHGPKAFWFINLNQKGAMSDRNRQWLSGSEWSWPCRLDWLTVAVCASHYYSLVCYVDMFVLHYLWIVYISWGFRFFISETDKKISYSFVWVIIVRHLVHTTYEYGTIRMFRNVGT